MSGIPPGAGAGSNQAGRPQRVRVLVPRGRWVLAGLLLLPVAELAVAILVGQWIGAWPTVLALLALSGVGLLILRREGLGAWRAMVDAAAAGDMPTPHRDPVDAALMLLAGLLFLVPGFITAAAGAVLLLPVGRRLLRGTLSRRIRIVSATGGPWWIQSRGQTEVIVGEVVTDPQPPRPANRPIEPPDRPAPGSEGSPHDGSPRDGSPQADGE